MVYMQWSDPQSTQEFIFSLHTVKLIYEFMSFEVLQEKHGKEGYTKNRNIPTVL